MSVLPESGLRSSPSALRNRAAILDVLRSVLPAEGVVLEIASGSGEHVVHFAEHTAPLIWQPSDPSPEARASIAGWIAHSTATTIRAPLDLDAARPTWPIDRADAVLAINMVHISPWAATLGLLDGAARLLPANGALILYGPYRRDGALAASNAAFDADLRSRDPHWGIRDLEEVVAAARGFALERVIEMPANNLTIVLRRGAL